MCDWNKTALVVAHLDDEVLWFSSIADKVDIVIICFLASPGRPEWGPGRLKALESHPLKNIRCLEIDEPGAFNTADWLSPKLSAYGIETPFKPQIEPGCRETFNEIVSHLSFILADYDVVVTHNPWGEYGHEEHILVHRAVEILRPELNYEIRFTNYFSNRSLYLVQECYTHLAPDYIPLNCNPTLGKSVKQILLKNNCWTWYDDWKWYPSESLLSLSDEAGEQPHWGPYPPLNPVFIHLKFRRPENKTLSKTVISKLKHWHALLSGRKTKVAS